jgi:5-methylcytosine-specific restriction endonuclease McrA
MEKEVTLARQDTRPYAQRRSYLIAAVRKRRKKVRQMAIEYKGGRCQKCGYDFCVDALEFHHSDSSEKDFSISEKGYTRSWSKVREELDKCILLCANCHREVHAKTQLLRETEDEKAGELLEAQTSRRG